MALGKRATRQLFFVDTPGLLSPVSSSDRLQIEQRTGLSMRATAPELTCGSYTAFEDDTGRCTARNFMTGATMSACEYYSGSLSRVGIERSSPDTMPLVEDLPQRGLETRTNDVYVATRGLAQEARNRLGMVMTESRSHGVNTFLGILAWETRFVKAADEPTW
jgi:hypothetical protein